MKRSLLHLSLFLLLTGSIGLQAQDTLQITDRPEVKITPLPLNSPADEFAATTARAGEFIVFTSNRRNGQRLYLTTRTTEDWSEPVMLDSALETAKHVGSATMTPDGNFMVFAAFEWVEGTPEQVGSGRTDLYSAEKQGGHWTNIRNLGPVVNSAAWDTHPSISSDGRVLYFASDRPGGLGGTDIYMTRRTGSSWSAPVNLGKPVNSGRSEISPFISPDGKRLFFSSNGHRGMGGYDLFVASGSNASGSGWSSIENMGTPINTAGDESFFVTIPNSKNSYFSSDLNGSMDVFLAYPNPFPPESQVTVSGKVRDANTKAPLGAKITITDLASGEVIADFKSDSANGDYFVILNKGRRYSITAQAPDHLFYTDEYPIPADAEGKSLTKDIDLRPVRGKVRLLVFFDYNKDTLKVESKPELERAVDFLVQNPNIQVEIAGHTDSLGSDAYNVDLSRRRAASVRQYIISRGIDPVRVESKGYGKTQPVADNGTDEGRAQNRRVEMIVKE